MRDDQPEDEPLERVLIVPDHNAGWRLDRFLAARFASWSRSSVQRALSRAEVWGEVGPLKASSRLRAGQRLSIRSPGIAPDAPAPHLPPVIYEDDRLLVLDKPAGLLVHPVGERFAWAVVGLARAARPGLSLDPVHRLDRETSGLLVLTKDPAASDFIQGLLRGRGGGLEKRYLAICRGQPDWDTRDCTAPIGQDPDRAVAPRRAVRPDGLPAHSRFILQRRLGFGLSLVEALLLTSRSHQLRVHLDHLGLPLLGDKLYGQPDATFLGFVASGETPELRAAVGFPRQALHAWRLRLPHPDGAVLELEAPLPVDLLAVVEGAAPEWPEYAEWGRG